MAAAWIYGASSLLCARGQLRAAPRSATDQWELIFIIRKSQEGKKIPNQRRAIEEALSCILLLAAVQLLWLRSRAHFVLGLTPFGL